jgi:FkbM family methyltransferase
MATRGLLYNIANRALKRPLPKKLTVETTSIDTEFLGEEIDFMKIDVQGGESDVLLGSNMMLRTQRINPGFPISAGLRLRGQPKEMAIS